MLQPNKKAQMTTSRDLFLRALETIGDPVYLKRHPCAIIKRDIIWIQSVEDFKSLLNDPLGLPEEDKYILKLCQKMISLSGKGQEKSNLMRLFCRESNSKVKSKKGMAFRDKFLENQKAPDTYQDMEMNLQKNSDLAQYVWTNMDVGHRQQKLFLWVHFCRHILEGMHGGCEKPETVPKLLRKTMNWSTDPQASAENTELAIVATLSKLFEKGSVSSVKGSEVMKTNKPLYTLGGLYVDYCHCKEDLANLQSIFIRLPVGVGDYEHSYIKPADFEPPDIIPFSSAEVDNGTIALLADLFYSPTTAICKEVEGNVVRGLERYHEKYKLPFHKSKYPHKVMHTILYPAVCSSWLKVLLKTGTIIFPTLAMTHLPGAYFGP